MNHRIVWMLLAACACNSTDTDHHEPAEPELAYGGFAPIDFTPLLRGGSGAAGAAMNQAGMAGATALATGGAATGGAATGGAAVLEMAGAAGSSTVATGGASLGGATSVLETAGAAGVVPSMAGASGSTGSGIRVLFGATYGSAMDQSIETMLILENKSGATVALKDLQLQYYIKLEPLKTMTCQCVDSICTMSTVGTVRTIYRAANAYVSWTFPGLELKDTRSVSLYISCKMDDGSPISELSHYSYPFGYEPGDPLPNVVVVYRSKVVWGTVPE
jgi:hypothetical protein